MRTPDITQRQEIINNAMQAWQDLPSPDRRNVRRQVDVAYDRWKEYVAARREAYDYLDELIKEDK